MGVSGSGKSTVGKMLADSLHWHFIDADAFHSQENIEKMTNGIPLTDTDRTPWLQTLQAAIKKWIQENQNVILACSALKASYRQYLLFDEKNIKLIFLKGSFDTIQKRLQARQNHFMSDALLQSQFDSLEEPDRAIIIDISQPINEIINNIRLSINF